METPHLPAPKGIVARLLHPTEVAGLVYFRIAFGTILMYEVWRYLAFDRVAPYFQEPKYLFPYWPFTHLEPWPGVWMEAHFWVLGVAAFFVAIGFLYRVSATVAFLAFTYVFLLDKARYLNHHYLVCLLAFLMILVPAHRAGSVDAWLRPRFRSSVVPAWAYVLLRFQVGVPYFFGGIAKLNGDWLRGEPLREWIGREQDFPILGPLFVHEPVVYAMAWGSVAIDLFVPLLLVFGRTRPIAFLIAMTFHLMNARLFNIGIFPWTMIAITVIFFPADWPRRVWRDVRREEAVRIGCLLTGFFLGFMVGGWLPGDLDWVHALVGGVGGLVFGYHASFWLRPEVEGFTLPLRGGYPESWLHRPRLVATFLALWVAVQCLLPLRHYVMPGNVHWNEEGHRWAWHMKLRDKESEPVFFVHDPATDETWRVDLHDYLTSRQIRKMGGRPDMIVQFVHHLEGLLRAEGRGDVEIRGQIAVSLNGRNAQLLVDPERDLSELEYPWWRPPDWILPLEEPLKQPRREPSNEP